MTTSERASSPRGRVFDLRRYSVHDGPGIRTTVFLQGCPLSCWWCHNPESQSPKSYLHWRSERCIACGGCVDRCPRQAVTLGPEGPVTDPRRCELCGDCVDTCPTLAREVVGRLRSVDELVAEVERDRAFFERSGGGVTVSGGEPLLQWRFLLSLLRACGERGLHRTVDTSGAARRDVLLSVAEEAELFLYDVKCMDPGRHLETTGTRNGPILDNLRALAETGVEIWLRVPLIPGINDDLENLERTARLARSLPSVRRLSLLPYHGSARGKHERFGRPWRLGEIAEIPAARLQELAGWLEGQGLEVQIGG